ncbi:MAG: hypothetical protein U0359_01270 [Byssovorax sp.]
MSFSRAFRSVLLLAAVAAMGATSTFLGCAQSNSPTSGGTTTGAGGGIASACYGTPPSCAGLDDFDCQTTNGCIHVGKCGGTAIDCSLLSPSGCLEQPGCTPMDFGNCSGSALPCFNFPSQSSCVTQQGCNWDQFNFFCSGNPIPCQQLPNASCSSQQGCTLAQAAACQGTPTACNTYMGEKECKTGLGCTWISSCDGTPKACETFAENDCPYQPGCACDGCTTSSSSSSSGEPLCKGQGDCDPNVDACKTGDCINGACVKKPNCLLCVKQVQCNPKTHPCLTGNCIDGACQAIANCQECTGPADCNNGVNKCFTSNCIDGKCEVKTMCTSGDGCCPEGCAAATDTDCQ